MTDADPLLVLSYNVCFQAMTHNATGSAAPLGAACTIVPGHTKLTRCALTMAHMIDGAPQALGLTNYAFAGFQEASRWYEFQPQAPRTLQKLELIHSRSGPSSMVSFFDAERFERVAEVNSEFSDGRPFHILVCRHRAGPGGVIFINAHYRHDNTARKREEAFSVISQILSGALEGQSLPSDIHEFRIIAVGDYNEAGWNWDDGSLYTDHWTPFAPMNIHTRIAIANTPYTCCQPDGDWSDGAGGIAQGARGGDYIFDSQAPATLEIPPNYDPRALCSDHLPVIARL